jgi:hypothetical protein
LNPPFSRWEEFEEYFERQKFEEEKRNGGLKKRVTVLKQKGSI